MSKTKKSAKKSTKKAGPAEEVWTASDWFAESARVQGDEGEPDRNNDAILCGAMLLAALEHGIEIAVIAAALEVAPSRIEVFHQNCRKCGVFADDGKVHANWFDEHGSTAFMMDVLVALGLAERAA